MSLRDRKKENGDRLENKIEQLIEGIRERSKQQNRTRLNAPEGTYQEQLDNHPQNECTKTRERHTTTEYKAKIKQLTDTAKI